MRISLRAHAFGVKWSYERPTRKEVHLSLREVPVRQSLRQLRQRLPAVLPPPLADRQRDAVEDVVLADDQLADAGALP
jgi:hypothetical protein